MLITNHELRVLILTPDFCLLQKKMSKRRRNKIPREPVETTIDALSHEGRGIARVEGKAVFVDGALPGEKVLFRYTRKRGSYAEGYAVEILKPSAKRVIPMCPHYGICGGCSLQHMQFQEQLQHKQNVLLEQLKQIGTVVPEGVLSPIHSQQWGYRRKARLGVKYVLKKGKLLVGFREKRSNYLADLQSCLVLHPDIGMRLTEIQALISSLDIYDQIPQIEAAVGENTTALIFRHLLQITGGDKERLRQFQNQTGIAIFLQSGGPETVIPLNEESNTGLSYRLEKYECIINFRPDEFTQVNFEINKLMIDQVMLLLEPGPGDNVLDLFCGLGNFSLPLARYSKKVTGIELSDSLVGRARINAARNKMKNAEFYAMDLMQDDLEAAFFYSDYQKILIDPPRNGAREVIIRLNLDKVRKLVYVSCNPATLARDAGILVKEKGMKLKKAGIMDMFPHTSHVESIALFERE